MADNDVVRENPLPVGRYWVVLTGKDMIDQFSAWSRESSKTGNFKVLSTETIAQSGIIRSKADILFLLTPILGAIVAAQRAKEPDQQFVVFEVTAPNSIMWSVAFGLPSRAAKNVTSVDQVEQAPPPEKDALDKLDDALKKVDVKGVLNTGLVLGSAYVAFKLFFGKRD